MIIGTDLIREINPLKLPLDFIDINHQLVKINPNDLNNTNLNDVEVYIGDRITPDIVKKLPKLRWIHLTSIGYDKLLGLKNKSIIITNSKDVIDDSVISLTLGFMFGLSSGFNFCLNGRPITRYDINENYSNIQDVFGQKCLIVGMGNIGKKLSKICNLMGVEVTGIRKTKGYTLDDLPNIIHNFDYVINLLPYNKDTYQVFNKDIFSKMKSTSFFINVGRGNTVVERDLIEVLKSNDIAGAGLDVFENEPLSPNSELWGLDNVIVTPHIGAFSNNYWTKQKKLFYSNIDRYLNKEPLINEVKL